MALISVSFLNKLHPVDISMQESFIGVAAAFFGLLVFYFSGLMGAGDVKFAAALGAWVGWELLLPIWALSCGFAVVHGVFAKSNFLYFFSFLMKWKGGSKENGRRFIPYVTYLSMATVIVLMLSQ